MDTQFSMLTMYMVSFVTATFFRWRGVHAYAVTPPPELKQRFRMNSGKWLSWLFTALPSIATIIVAMIGGWTFFESLGLSFALAFLFLALMHTIPHL